VAEGPSQIFACVKSEPEAAYDFILISTWDAAKDRAFIYGL